MTTDFSMEDLQPPMLLLVQILQQGKQVFPMDPPTTLTLHLLLAWSSLFVPVHPDQKVTLLLWDQSPNNF
jgi:hypothetical protein